MSYSHILRRISRLIQSSVNSILTESEKEVGRAFDEELRNAQQKGSAGTDTGRNEEERKQSEQSSGGAAEGARKPGERDDAYYFAVLGLTPAATADQIKSAYRKLMAQYHPDKAATLGPELQRTAVEKSKTINEAYMIIERRRGMK